ncbi:MAG: nucleoid-associated protein [Verrucomicrobiota bacterium]
MLTTNSDFISGRNQPDNRRQLIMPLNVNFSESAITALALAKVGNPIREEPLLVSKNLCKFNDREADLLTTCFLKPFRSLDLHQLDGERGPQDNPLFRIATQVFNQDAPLIDAASEIAGHLYATSNHPNIKSGDLCISLVDGIIIGGHAVKGLCLIKSEMKVPFLQIRENGGDLTLKTQEGISPDKVDKGCLILDYQSEDGYAVYLFDKSGHTHFWNHEFAGAIAVRNEEYLTKRYGEMCVEFAKSGMPETVNEEKRLEVANNALAYLNEANQFEIDDFTESFGGPKMVEEISEFKEQFENETGVELEDSFEISKPEARKAKKKLKGRVRVDTGAEVVFSSAFIDQSHRYLERGYDQAKGMKYMKIFFSHELH